MSNLNESNQDSSEEIKLSPTKVNCENSNNGTDQPSEKINPENQNENLKNCDNIKVHIENNNNTTKTDKIEKTSLNKSNGIITNLFDAKNKNETPTEIKSILTPSNSDSNSSSKNDTLQRKTLKKSVTFDPDSEIVKKFIEGEVIIDKQNPFKNGDINQPINAQSTTLSTKQRIPSLKLARTNSRRQQNQPNRIRQLPPEEYVTKEQVLNESKYVKTYIKNPDKYFVYDPTIIAKIKFEELRELKNKKPPRRIRFSSQTSERLKEIKKQHQSLKTATSVTKIPSYKKVTKANYPDLADIKVKTGTDLEESFFNPEEVTINAKKFDECVKKLHISSDDDLDEIDAELTRTEDESELISIKEEDSNQVNNINDNSIDKKSFTNTVNSKEFQEFLEKKGLTLTPKRTMLNGDVKKHENSLRQLQNFNKRINNNIIDMDNQQSNSITPAMEPKKTKKQSMFQRLLPTNIFSSKRKTTPKDEPVPIANNQLYSTTTSNQDKKEKHSTENTPTKTPSSPLKRIILERQSFHGAASTLKTQNNSNSNSANDLRKYIERSRRSYDADDRSASISSVLTNVEENYERDREQNGSRSISMPETKETSVTPTPAVRKSSKEYANSKLVRGSKLRRSSSRERIQNSHSKSGSSGTTDGRDVILKSRIQKSQMNKSLPSKTIQKSDKNDTRKNVEKQNTSKSTISSSQDSTITRKSNSLPKVSSKSMRNNGTNSLELSKSNSTENGPKSTSTPIRTPTKSKLNDKKSVVTPPERRISPIEITKTLKTYEIGPEEWVKLQEMKERTDRELFNRAPVPVETMERYPNRENIYEKLPVVNRNSLERQQPSTTTSIQNPPEAGFTRRSSQRNTISGMPMNNRYVKVIDGNSYSGGIPENILRIPEPRASRQIEPPRCQSVMDEMITGHHLQPISEKVGGTPVIMRRKGRVLSREEILNKVKEFCRKSMNRTPTNIPSNQQTQQQTITEEKTSPVSYASVDYQNRGINRKCAPQVPQRIQSLQSTSASKQTSQVQFQQIPSPIYAHVLKRSSVQSHMSDTYDNQHKRTPITVDVHQTNSLRSRASTISDTDSVFMPVQASSNSPSERYIFYPNTVAGAPPRTIKYQNEIAYRQSAMPSPYGFIQLKPQQTRDSADAGSSSGAMSSPSYRASPITIQHSPRYYAVQHISESQQHSLQMMQLQKQQQHHHQQQQQKLLQSQQPATSVVYLKVKDQIYTPISNMGAANNYIPPSYPSQQSYNSTGRQQFRQKILYESESGSEAGEVQRILQNRNIDEDWQNDKSGRSQSSEQASDDRRRSSRREDPRRHTLGGDMLQYGQGHMPQQRAMDLEMGTRVQRSKKPPTVRGYTPINQGPLFDDDPGIMSEVETASTGIRRGSKSRSSLPVVRTPSKTLERPLGLVFLQYRSETKRALLPNEITAIDTVRALFVRSFPRQLTMAYLEGPNVKIYIHDASKDMFYELEDNRSHLREIRDRSVLRLFESNEVAAPQVLPGGAGVPQPLPPPTGSGHWDQDQSYFSEPEFDSEYQHQHIHKSKGSKPAPYYVGGTQTLPRGMYSDRNKNPVGAPVKPLRSYGSRGNMGPAFPYTPDQLYSIPADGYTSSPERATRTGYEEPYYSQYGTHGNAVAPIISEEQRCDGPITEDQYALYGMKVSGRIPRSSNQLYDPTRPEDLHRIRVEHMERQLANLTGLVQKALIQNPQMASQVGALNANYLTIPGHCRGLEDMDGHSSGSSTSIQDKSVSFEKSVSFSDDIQGVPKSHSPQHSADSKPPKPAIKSSTLPRTSSQERDRLKPPPPPKPLTLAAGHPNYRPDIALAPEVYNHLRGLQKKAKDLRMEVRTLRRLSQAQAVAVREDIKDAFMRIRATLLASSGTYWGQSDQEKIRISREEELYKQEVIRLEKDLTDLESSVESLRGEVINRRTRVNMAAVEDMALVLSRASKTVAELKMRFPGLQLNLRNILANEMEKVVREEKFLKEEPDRLESALRRCKKLTGTLVTLKRLASVQEQRLPPVETVSEDQPRSAEITSANKPIPSPRMGTITVSGGVPPENALDALLDELQTFAKPQQQKPGDVRLDDTISDENFQTLQNTITTQHSQANVFPSNELNIPQNTSAILGVANGYNQANFNSLRRLHSYPSGSDTDTSPPQPSRPVGKPPVPERNAELLSKVSNKRIPPPPPPRTSSRSPLASPTSSNVPQRLPSVSETDQTGNENGNDQDGSGNSSGNESGNDHVQRQLALEMRHQELLKKQKLLQEQYARLQAMSKNSINIPVTTNEVLQLKKTGSESNLPQKMGLSLTVTGSMKNLNAEINVDEKNEKNLLNSATKSEDLSTQSSEAVATSNAATTSDTIDSTENTTNTGTTTNKVYETDIL